MDGIAGAKHTMIFPVMFPDPRFFLSHLMPERMCYLIFILSMYYVVVHHFCYVERYKLYIMYLEK